MSKKVLVYILRRDLRIKDNPVISNILAQHKEKSFTHLLPLYVFPAHQIEVSGFLKEDAQKCPYPEARSEAGAFWRCGPQRARFIAESVYDLQKSLRDRQSDLFVRVGYVEDTLKSLFDAYKESSEYQISHVWMTAEDGVEERREEVETREVVENHEAEFKMWKDERYFIDDRDVPLASIQDLPEPFTSYRNMVEPLRDGPRQTIKSTDQSLAPAPWVPAQADPFTIPDTLDGTLSCLLKPLESKPDIDTDPPISSYAKSAHPFKGGETSGHDRVQHLVSSGAVTTYKDTRNGMLGEDFSTKLSAWLALGSLTARQIHEYLLNFEDGRTDLGKSAKGYGKGENKGTHWIRFELLWRDYMRLCGRKYRQQMFKVEGMKRDQKTQWKYADNKATRQIVSRFLKGETGNSCECPFSKGPACGLVDASQRELLHTGYTSNRARQNVGSFLARHLGIDWRIGAEWYESRLVDYETPIFGQVANSLTDSNWGNWQAVSITDRIFNPVKQSYDYDPNGEYCKTWVQELGNITEVEAIFQPWKTPQDKRKELGIDNLVSVSDPLKRIEFRPSRSKEGGKNGGGKYAKGNKGRKQGKNKEKRHGDAGQQH